MRAQRVKTSVKKVLALHSERNPDLPFSQAYDESVAYIRRTQQLPDGPKIPEHTSPASSLNGITPEHATRAVMVASELAQFNDWDITEIRAEDYRTFFRWRYVNPVVNKLKH